MHINFTARRTGHNHLHSSMSQRFGVDDTVWETFHGHTSTLDITEDIDLRAAWGRYRGEILGRDVVFRLEEDSYYRDVMRALIREYKRGTRCRDEIVRILEQEVNHMMRFRKVSGPLRQHSDTFLDLGIRRIPREA